MSEKQAPENPTVVLQKMHRYRMAFFGMVILLAGVVIGAASTAVYLHDRLPALPPGPGFLTGRMLAGLEERLALSPEQAGKIKPLVEKRFQIMQDLQNEFRPKFGEQFRLMHEEILAQLDENQKQRWEEDLKRMQEHWPRGMRGGPRGPGGSRRSGGPGGSRGPGGQFRPDQERRDDSRRPFPDGQHRPPQRWRQHPNDPPTILPGEERTGSEPNE